MSRDRRLAEISGLHGLCSAGVLGKHYPAGKEPHDDMFAWIVRHRWVVILTVVAVTFAFTWHLDRLRMDPDVEAYVPKYHPDNASLTRQRNTGHETHILSDPSGGLCLYSLLCVGLRVRATDEQRRHTDGR